MSIPTEIAQLPTIDTVQSTTRLLVQDGVTGTPYQQTTVGAVFLDLIDEIGTGTVVAGDVLISGGTADLDLLIAAEGTITDATIIGGTGTFTTGSIATLAVGGTLTVGTVAATILNAGTVDISGGKATLATGTITAGTVGTLTSTTGTITTLNAGTITIGTGTGTLTALTVAGTLDATVANVPTLAVSGTATVGHVAATSVTASGAIVGASGTITSINGGTITSSGAVSGATGTFTTGTIHTLAVSGTATVGNVLATTGTITSLNAPTLTVDGVATISATPDLRLSILGDQFMWDSTGALFGYVSNDGVQITTSSKTTTFEVGTISAIATDIPVSGMLGFSGTTYGTKYGTTTVTEADPRLAILGDGVATDSTGALVGYVSTTGVHHFAHINAGKVTISTPVDDTDAAPKSYVDGKSSNPWLEPARDYAAPDDGTTDASTEVNACFAAAIARGDRYVNVEEDYEVPTLDKQVGDLICIGNGSFLSSPIVKYVVPSTAPPIPAIPRTLKARVHCPNAVAAAALGTVRVVFTGDSVSRWGVAEFSYFATICALTKEAFLRDNPGVVFEWFNRGVGGGNWETLNSIPANTSVDWYTDDLKPWLEYIEELEPDLVIVSCSRNGASAFEWGDMTAAIATIQGWITPCDVLVCNSVGETQTALTEDWITTRTGWESTEQAIRAYCLWAGIGLIDTGSMESLARFGYAQEYMAQLRDTVAFGAGTGMQQIALPWTAATEVYGYTIQCRIKIGGWTDMDNEIRFSLAGSLTANMAGCALILRRDIADDSISYEVRITDTEAGAASTWTLVAETAAGVTCTDAEIITVVVGVQGSRLQLHFPNEGEPQAPLYITIPRNGGMFAPTITCAAGTIGTGAIELSGLTGKPTYCAASRPRPEILYMPVLTDREFASPSDEDLDWGGSGPHPGSLAVPRIYWPAVFVNDYTLI